MKTLLLSSIVVLGLASGALAADLPVRSAPPPPPAGAPVFTWTGFYAGVNVGWGHRDDEPDRDRLYVPRSPRPGCPPCNVQPPGLPPGTAVLRPAGGSSFLRQGSGSDSGSGILGGGQVGFNLQAGLFVFGLEADVQAIDLGGGRDGRLGDRNGYAVASAVPSVIAGRGVVAPVNPGGVGPGAANVAFFGNGQFGSRSNIDLFGTLRGRAGISFDRLLVYATGGLAWADRDVESFGGLRSGADVPRSFFVAQPDAAGNLASTAAARVRATPRGGSADSLGWVLGGGLEYAFHGNLSVKLEGLYVSFDEETILTRGSVVGVTNTGAPIRYSGSTISYDNDFALVRAGLNYRFGTF